MAGGIEGTFALSLSHSFSCPEIKKEKERKGHQPPIGIQPVASGLPCETIIISSNIPMSFFPTTSPLH